MLSISAIVETKTCYVVAKKSKLDEKFMTFYFSNELPFYKQDKQVKLLTRLLD